MSFIVKARQAERGGDNIKEWTGLKFDMSQRQSKTQKWRKLDVKSSVVSQRPLWLRDR